MQSDSEILSELRAIVNEFTGFSKLFSAKLVRRLMKFVRHHRSEAYKAGLEKGKEMK